MIVEIALVVTVTGAAVGAVAAALRARRARSASPASELGKALAAARDERGSARGLRPGDVLMIPGEELALGGVLTLEEGGVVLRAFPIIGAAAGRWLVQLDDAESDLVLAAESSALGEGAVPATLPLGGRTLTLEKRGHGRLSGSGDAVPRIEGERAPYVVLAERGGRVAIAIDRPSGRLGLVGERLDPRVVDRLGGGDVPRS
ncbi:MAG: hypothetical protein U0234_08055 [Sandaracinus sp.]